MENIHESHKEKPQPDHDHVIHYLVDNEPQTTAERELSVREILEKIPLDPNTHYLIELKGNHQIPHKDLGEVIKLHNNMKFITVFTGETPVS